MITYVSMIHLFKQKKNKTLYEEAKDHHDLSSRKPFYNSLHLQLFYLNLSQSDN